jgi:hypothetical protein
MNVWSSAAKRAGVALLVGAFALGAVACSSDPDEDLVDQTEDLVDQTEDQVEDRVDDVEEDVRENTP